MIGAVQTALKRAGRVFVGPSDPTLQIIEALEDILTHKDYISRNAVLLIGQLDGRDALQAQFSPSELDIICRTLELRLKGGLLARDVVRRLPGGQYACVMSPLHHYSPEDVMVVVGQIQNLIAVPVVQDDIYAKLSMSIGCAMTKMADFSKGAHMFEAGRVAVSKAVSKGPAGLEFFTNPMGEELALRQDLRKDVTAAIGSGAIHAHFQPQISLCKGDVSGFEALARWHHPDKGVISPGAFLPVLEDLGMMRMLGRIMLRDALKALRAWDAAGYDVPSVSVNMCTDELCHPDIVNEISFQLEKYNIAANRLVIEVLETVYADDSDDPIITNLAALSQLGCRLDLDDFGTGYASIKSIRRFAVDRVKIDRTFIVDIAGDTEQQQVVRTILSMAKHMGVSTLAEGVETSEELSYLTTAGCEHAQGYVIGRPVSQAEATDWLSARRTPERAETAV